MATTKVTITLEQDQLEEIRKLVAAGTAATVSGFVILSLPGIDEPEVCGYFERAGLRDRYDEPAGFPGTWWAQDITMIPFIGQ